MFILQSVIPYELLQEKESFCDNLHLLFIKIRTQLTLNTRETDEFLSSLEFYYQLFYKQVECKKLR